MQKWSADITKTSCGQSPLGRDFQLKSGALGRLLVKAGRNRRVLAAALAGCLEGLKAK